MVREPHQPMHDHRSQGEQLRPLQAVHRCVRPRGKDVLVRAVEGFEGLRARCVKHVPALHGLLASGMRARRLTIISLPRGIQTAPTVTASGTFQPYHRPRHPDFLQPAAVSIELWRMTPCSRCCLCHTALTVALACFAPLVIYDHASPLSNACDVGWRGKESLLPGVRTRPVRACLRGSSCVMRMPLAGMEVPGYHANKALVVAERPHEQPVRRC
jgi:hypothetical protein